MLHKHTHTHVNTHTPTLSLSPLSLSLPLSLSISLSLSPLAFSLSLCCVCVLNDSNLSPQVCPPTKPASWWRRQTCPSASPPLPPACPSPPPPPPPPTPPPPLWRPWQRQDDHSHRWRQASLTRLPWWPFQSLTPALRRVRPLVCVCGEGGVCGCLFQV